jgi:formate-dependent nitrite reductase cytochrome c552 subunit
MMRTAAFCLAISGLLTIFSSRAEAFKCNVCHSKNPAMVRMHNGIREKDIGCFDCHKVGDKLMGKGRPTSREALLQRRTTEQVCIQCHATRVQGDRTALVPAKP